MSETGISLLLIWHEDDVYGKNCYNGKMVSFLMDICYYKIAKCRYMD